IVPNSSRSHIASVPLGLAARAMRAVSAGMGPMAWGYIVMLLLLLSARRFRFPVSYHFYFYFHSPAESKGPHRPTSTALAPTDVAGLLLVGIRFPFPKDASDFYDR